MSGTNAAAEPGGATPAPAPAAAPNGADTGEGKTYTVTDSRSAGDAIAGLLFGADDDAAPAGAATGDQPSGGDQPSADTGAETPPTGEEDDKGSGEPAAAPAIEAPASWSTDEKAAFAQLPPALQQTVARRESQREAALTQRSMEAADARKAFEAERMAATAQRVEYLQGLQKMLVLAAPEAAALNNVDWVAVQAQSPAEYTRLQALREQLRSRLGAIETAFQQQQQQLSFQQQQQLAQLVAKEQEALSARMPDFGDEVKGPPLRKELVGYLRESGGFTADEINTAYDHRLVVLATKAMLYDRQHNLAAAADAKRNNVPPRVQPPGTSQEGDRGPQQRFRAQVDRFRRTNSARDAGSLIAEIL